MNKNEIAEVLAELYKITGFRASLHGADYSEIAAYPKDKHPFCKKIQESECEYAECVRCDKAACTHALEIKDTVIYKCRHGFTEAASPLYNFGTLTGFLMMGQVCESEADRDAMRRTLLELGVAEDEAAEMSSVRVVNHDMVHSYVKIMTICAQYLTLSNAIPNEKPTVPEMAQRYIYENYHKKIGIKDICQSIGCSKSTLITSFKKQFDMTVNEYITNVRLTEAARMLSMPQDISMYEIASRCGFSDQSYFSKVFSAKYGKCPREYGRHNKLWS